ncbi:hypothetical protein BJX68DRAFT_271015 [Aspergillus pseudodeflectus]|uniref:Arrestin-like N-terminal domain-containing protein n=1 Tax=Aspergillus pseudodeflectus TaxID=176178 RepID=A0ABR4JP78_9EURO
MSTYYPHHAEQRHEPSLAITLDVPVSTSHSYSHSKPTYKPGDTISGHVYRVDPSFIPEATVMVTLLGHSKTTIRARGPGSSELRYESSFKIFAGCFDTLVLHSRAPLSGPEMSWPFALTIPFSVLDVRDSQHCEGERASFYASPDGSSGPSFIPPATFAVAEEFSYEDGSRVSASIEYMVQAKIEIAQGYYDETGKPFVQKVDPVTSPFTLSSVSYSPPMTDLSNKVETFQRGVSTFRLIPGVEGKLSLAQKTHQALLSSRVPSFVMRASVSLPRFLQVGYPEVIPVIVYFEGVSASCKVIEDAPQVITVKSLTLNLRPRTVFLAEFKPSYGGPPRRKTSKKTGTAIPMLPSTAISDMKRAYDQEISFTVTSGSTGSGAGSEIQECEPLDLGAILDLRMVNHVHPTFRTYNVARTWELAWEMDLEVAGEKVRVGSAHEVVILPRAWEGPPPDVAGESLHLHEQVRGGDLLPGYAGRDEELPAYSA